LQEWRENKSISFAIQLLATARIFNLTDSKEYEEASIFIKNFNEQKNIFSNNPLLSDFLDIETDTESPEIINARDRLRPIIKIHELKSKILTNYKDSILWMDLAYFHFILGNREKAKKYIKIALNLNNYNPHVVRSAARFYLFLDEPEKAISIIRKSPNLLHNPLILSSEIAISEAFELNTKNAKKSFNLLTNKNIPTNMLSELNATIATLEYNYGNIKNTKRHIFSTLLRPNENALAQIQFLNEKRNVPFSTETYDIPFRYEADTWSHYQNFRYKEAVIESNKWHHLQRFSTRPTLLNSFIQATFFNKNEDAIAIIDETLKLKVNDPALLNNKAFSLAKLGKIEEAEDCLTKITEGVPDLTDAATIKATHGLVEYRKNNQELGRKLYKEAIETFGQIRDFTRQTRALFYMYIEERRYNLKEAEPIKIKAEELANRHHIKESEFLFATLK
jgi:tetratricopeptide (TPR) repeat protein